VNKHVEALLASITEELAAASGEDKHQCEAKSLFRLLNYCPPEVKQQPLGNAESRDGEDN
jgi:hypothetical protein